MIVINAWERAIYRQVPIPIEGPPSIDMPFAPDDYGPFLGSTVELHVRGRKYHLLCAVREDGTADMIDIDTGDIETLRINFTMANGKNWSPDSCS